MGCTSPRWGYRIRKFVFTRLVLHHIATPGVSHSKNFFGASGLRGEKIRTIKARGQRHSVGFDATIVT
jgi:hypothetical protein